MNFSILDANRLTVGEYDKARLGVKKGLHRYMEDRTKVELQNEQTMNDAIRTEIDSLSNQWSSDSQIKIE
jgi:hypothetical protein